MVSEAKYKLRYQCDTQETSPVLFGLASIGVHRRTGCNAPDPKNDVSLALCFPSQTSSSEMISGNSAPPCSRCRLPGLYHVTELARKSLRGYGPHRLLVGHRTYGSEQEWHTPPARSSKHILYRDRLCLLSGSPCLRHLTACLFLALPRTTRPKQLWSPRST